MACIYGDIKKIEGVKASEKVTCNELGEMNKYRTIIIEVGTALKMDPAVIAGIISRESRAGLDLKDGKGKDENHSGLMQVDTRAICELQKPWDSKEHLEQGTKYLIDCINKIKQKNCFSNQPKECQLQGGIAAYNCGPEKVHSYECIDENTKGKDYSRDVVARALFFKYDGY